MREIRLTPNMDAATKAHLLDSAIREDKNMSSYLRVWIEGVTENDDALAAEKGFTAYRDLWQMTCALPLKMPPKIKAAAEKLQVRPFTPADTDVFLKVQNRAFAWHPEEADMDTAELNKRQNEAWYDPDDFLLLFEGGNNGGGSNELIGFCWTKIHKHPAQHPAQHFEGGEIYMIGIDPDQQGKKLGELLTHRGFQHLAEKGQTLGMLYVESDNHAATATYKKMGLKTTSINRAYAYQI